MVLCPWKYLQEVTHNPSSRCPHSAPVLLPIIDLIFIFWNNFLVKYPALYDPGINHSSAKGLTSIIFNKNLFKNQWIDFN
jgi:hypothetical protein